MSEFEYDVFLSYASADKAAVRELAQKLKGDGLKVWFDECVIQAGDLILPAIEQGLESSRTLVLVMSQAFFESKWATFEQHTFRFKDPTNQQRRFIPLRLDDCNIKDSLRQFAYVDWRTRDEGEYKNLLDVCVGSDRAPQRNDADTASKWNAIRVCVRLEMDRDFEAFDEAAEAEILAAIQNLLHISREVTLASKGRGSVVVTIDLTAREAKRLIRAIYCQQLQRLRVARARIVPIRYHLLPSATQGAVMTLTIDQRRQLAKWRQEVYQNANVLSQGRVDEITFEVSAWEYVRLLEDRNANAYGVFSEHLNVFHDDGSSAGVRAIRGICHWIGLRHGCVHGLLINENGLTVLQRRARWLANSPSKADLSFTGHMGVNSAVEAMESEALQEAGVDLRETSPAVICKGDLTPIHQYSYYGGPAIDEEYYNAEYRFVFAIRVRNEAVGNLQPIDQEVAGFELVPIKLVWDRIRNGDVATGLSHSAPYALRYAMKEWGYGF